MAGTGAAFAATAGRALADGGEATTRRFTEQRWALDNIIRANGIDWDQPRSLYLSAPCGVEANADFAAIRARVQKMADIGPAFESTARRREAKAKDAEAAGNLITARDNWYMAAIHYGAAEWPYDDSGKLHEELHTKKRECYGKYAKLAEHKVEAVADSVQRQIDPRLVSSAARLCRRQDPGGDRDPGHGQFQGKQRGARQ